MILFVHTSVLVVFMFAIVILYVLNKQKDEIIKTMTKINEDWANEVLRLTRELEKGREL